MSVNYTSYREIPFSEETPEDDYHVFMTIKQVLNKATKHQNHIYQCRTVGVVCRDIGIFAIQEIENENIRIRLSVKYLKQQITFTGLPFTAQLFGIVHWQPECGGPVMYAETLTAVPSSLVDGIRSAMMAISRDFGMNYQREDNRVPVESSPVPVPEDPLDLSLTTRLRRQLADFEEQCAWRTGDWVFYAYRIDVAVVNPLLQHFGLWKSNEIVLNRMKKVPRDSCSDHEEPVDMSVSTQTGRLRWLAAFQEQYARLTSGWERTPQQGLDPYSPPPEHLGSRYPPYLP